MPNSNLTEDIEFLTDVNTRGSVVRRGKFIKRPRRVNGRNVPGNARYYRQRQRELLAGRRAAQRATEGSRRAARGAARGRAANNPAAPAAGARRTGLGTRIRRGIRAAARGIERH